MTGLFEIISIETRNTCTRKCWFCKFGQERQDPQIVEMDWALIERIVYNLQDLNYSGRISWYWINEPLLEKRIFDILAFTREHCPRAFLTLVTNGDLLTEDVYRKLRSQGLDALGVSIYDDKTEALVRQMKKDDRLVRLDMRSPIGKLENRGGTVKRHAEVFERDLEERQTLSCGRPSKMMQINARGQVVLCCSDMYSDVIMGEAAVTRLEEIWQNEKFRHYRTNLSKGERANLDLCKSCSYNGKANGSYFPLQSDPRLVTFTFRY